MRHRLFRAVVVMGAAVGCSSGEATTNPPMPLDSTTDAVGDATSPGDSATEADSIATDSTASEAAPDSTTTDTGAPPDTAAMMDVCVEEGCGCFPCIK